MTILNKYLISFMGFFSFLISCNSEAQQTDLTVPDFEKAITGNDIRLLDVRTESEYQSGHLKNALLANWNDETEFQERVKALDKNKPVYTYCLSGARSHSATLWLRQHGFTAYNLSGGITAWKNAGKPVDLVKTVPQISLDEYLSQIPKDRTVLVDISATWCPPCKTMAPIVDSLVKANADRFVLVKIDGGDQTDICGKLSVSGFPTFIVYKNGKEVFRKEGLVDAKEMISWF
ncbi:MAG TPA: thioredoxin domain-containing protein [Puia sp.]|nr:thioredoxin domain-containing protein [Puia sp.]